MKIVFMGTARFALPSLRALLKAGHTIEGVITQPDRPRGRKRKLAVSPIKAEALELGLQLSQPESIRSAQALEQLQAWEPELIVVAAYGQIIPQAILELAPYGSINVHGSLLPHYRGAAPIQWALINGEKETGVTTMYMDQGVDTGDIILKKALPVDEDIYYGQLQEQLAQLGAELIVQTVAAIATGTAPREKQDEAQATYAPALKSTDEMIHWDRDASDIHNQIRALSPQPGAATLWQGSQFKIYKSRVESAVGQGTPGLVQLTDSGLLVETGAGRLELLEVQRAGRKRMSIQAYMAGQRDLNGIILG